jgi:hypothetical protein
MQTPHNCTWYHLSVVEGAETYTRTPITGVFWSDRKGRTAIEQGTMKSNQVTVFIPKSSGSFAIQGEDVLVKGIVTDEITAQFTMGDLYKKYTDVVKVRNVDARDFGSEPLQHVELGCS